MHEAVIGLGSNLGSRGAMLETALSCLAHAPGVQLLTRSRTYVTAPVGPHQPDFLNAAVRVRWQGTAHGLLDTLLHIEALIGRVRRERWGPRCIDLDLLWWTGPDVRSSRLTVPHPEVWGRAFALAPLLDVAPELSRRGEPALRAAGGTPARLHTDPHRASPVAVSHHPDVAEAVAAAGTWFGHSLAEPTGARWSSMAWDPTPVGESLDRALQGIAQAARAGFRVQRALVLDTRSAPWLGRLLGTSAPASPAWNLPVPRWRLEGAHDGAQVKLSLSG